MENKSCKDCQHCKRRDQYTGFCRQILMSISNELADLDDMCVPLDGFYCAEHEYKLETVSA